MVADFPRFSREDIRNILTTEFVHHPQARLVDCYKLLNQAYYGPTHIDPDPLKIAQHLRLELGSITHSNEVLCQDIGCGRGFYRINLIALITATTELTPEYSERCKELSQKQIEAFTECILASRLTCQISPQTWEEQWQNALPVVLEFIDPTFDEISHISSLLSKDQLPSHSDIYRNLYRPHYRVIHHTQRPNIPI